ncbi:MAG TPA: ABC transporter permease [Lentimicrobium sp.]|nr:ABC transporter permease [Lentimicrobium sp.]
MNFEYFISRRIRIKTGASFSRPIIRVSITGIALGLSVMLISVAVLKGFQKEIRQKVVGFGSEIQISQFNSNNSYEPTPINVQKSDLSKVAAIPGVTHISPFGLKAGIIKSRDQIQGVVLKGVDKAYNWTFFKEKLISGRVPAYNDTSASNEILLSKRTADLLNFKVGDDVRMYFIINNNVRARKFTISGIYETGLIEFDDMYVLGDIRHIINLNLWSEGEVSGYEIAIKDFDKIDQISEQVYSVIGYDLNTQTIKQIYPQIFDWIEIQDLNVIVILVLMTLVSGITIISTLLILILEHTSDIGVLKAMGARTGSIRMIFLYASGYIVFYGLLWGNLFALGLIWIQKTFEIIPLPPESYFLSQVPVSIGVIEIVVINIATIVISFLMMLIPSMIIKYISPVRAIRFD